MIHTVRVPASSANLGPGFDALGLALELFLVCKFERSDNLHITASGIDAGTLPCDESNLIWQTALRVASDVGGDLPKVKLSIHNEIPIGKGLGSSAAALTAGVVIADSLLNLEWSRHRILDEAASIEGHPDNVSACVLGSVVASAIDEHGSTHAVRLELPLNYGVAIVVPDFALPTVEARAVLPNSYSREDVVFNVQRSALLIAALCTGNMDSFSAALVDRLHHPYRAKLVPGLTDILHLRANGLLGCTLSGAGPSILVFYERGSEHVTKQVADIFRRHGHDATVYATKIQRSGYCLDAG